VRKWLVTLAISFPVCVGTYVIAVHVQATYLQWLALYLVTLAFATVVWSRV